jgi:two-component system chemotaxis response regulator CheB
MPDPIIVVSGVSRRAADVTLKAFDLGAVDFIFKYSPSLDTSPEALFQELIGKVRSAAKVKVVRSIRSRKPGWTLVSAMAAQLQPEAPSAEARTSRNGTEGVVVIGASTGGPLAIRELLSGLSPSCRCRS